MKCPDCKIKMKILIDSDEQKVFLCRKHNDHQIMYIKYNNIFRLAMYSTNNKPEEKILSIESFRDSYSVSGYNKNHYLWISELNIHTKELNTKLDEI